MINLTAGIARLNWSESNFWGTESNFCPQKQEKQKQCANQEGQEAAWLEKTKFSKTELIPDLCRKMTPLIFCTPWSTVPRYPLCGCCTNKTVYFYMGPLKIAFSVTIAALFKMI